jgi:hypothetical protein
LTDQGLFDPLTSVACEPTTSTCYAVGGTNGNYLVPIVHGVAGTAQLLFLLGSASAITCTSATQCLAVGTGEPSQNRSGAPGLVLPLTKGVPGTPVDVSDGPSLQGVITFVSVVCATPTQCLAAGDDVLDHSIPPLPPGTPPSFGVDVAITNGVPGALQLDESVNVISNGVCSTTTNCLFSTYLNSTLALAVVPIDSNGIPGPTEPVPGGAFPALTGSIVCPDSPSTCSLWGVNSKYQSIIVPLVDGTFGTPTVVSGTSGTLRGTCPTSSSCVALTEPSDGHMVPYQGNVFTLSAPATNVGLPSNGATLSGTIYLDAAASDSVGVTSVTYVLSGGAYSQAAVASATPTSYGWLGGWNTTTVPNGTYTLQSVATNAEGLSTTSAPITVTVANPPTTFITIPSNGANISGTQLLDAGASNGVTKVVFKISGGPLNGTVVATGTATYYGWLAQWNTKTVPNGPFTLQSVASYASGPSGTSAGVNVTVAN